MNFLSCSKMSKLMSASLDRPLTRYERFQLRMHLYICRFCRRFFSQIQLIRKAFHHFFNETEQAQIPKSVVRVIKAMLE